MSHIYTIANHSKNVDYLTSARDCAGVALLNSHTIIFSGESIGGGVEAHLASSLSRVEVQSYPPNIVTIY